MTMLLSRQQQTQAAMHGTRTLGLGTIRARFGRARVVSIFYAVGKRARTHSRAPKVSRTAQVRPQNGGMKTMDNSRARTNRKILSARGNNRHYVGKIQTRDRLVTDDVTKGMAEVLQSKYSRLRSPAKEMAADTGNNERACRNHLYGVNAMRLHEFFNACRSGNCPELTEWGMEMMGALQRGDSERVHQLTQGHQAITLRIEADGVKVTT